MRIEEEKLNNLFSTRGKRKKKKQRSDAFHCTGKINFVQRENRCNFLAIKLEIPVLPLYSPAYACARYNLAETIS